MFVDIDYATELWGVDAPEMRGAPCFALIVRNGIVIQAAPIAKWTIGKPMSAAARWYKSKGAKVELLRPAYE